MSATLAATLAATLICNVDLDQIEANPVALRDVNKESLDYIQTRDSIARMGVLNAISLQPIVAPDGKSAKFTTDGRQMYRIIDGAHRTMASRDLGLKTIPAQIFAVSDSEVMKMQVVSNSKRIDTTPFQFSRHLKRILVDNKTKTLNEMAAELFMSPEWLTKRMGIANLDESVGALVDEGKISIGNAVALAKLPPESQKDFVDLAMKEKNDVFTSKVLETAKKIRDDKRAAKPASAPEHVIVAHLRKKAEIEATLTDSTFNALLSAAAITDPVEAAKFAIRWALHLDQASIDKDKAMFEQHQQDLKDKAAKRADERAAAKAKADAAAATPATV